MAKASVLMPCYNSADTLEEALASVIGQTFEDFEIVVVDDGSTDGTVEILRSWERRDARIVLVLGVHDGIVSALNRGLAACRAPYVVRMDADDRIHPDRIALQVSYLEAHHDVDVVSCKVKGFPDEGVREGFRLYMEWQNSLITNEDIRREMFVESPVPHPSATFRRKRIEQIGGYQDHGWAEDYDLWLRLYLEGVRFYKLPQILLEWREHPQRLTRTDPRYSLENFLRAKAYYLCRGPLIGRDALILWGAGMMGRRISKQLARQGAALVAFIDIDPRKIGRKLRGLPIEDSDEIPVMWRKYKQPALLAAVGARGARPLIRQRLESYGLVEGVDWWSVA